MAETTIEWADYTFNCWSGCTKVSPGCAHCYAEVNYSAKVRGVKWGPQGNRIVKAESGWKEPLKWDKQAAKREEDYERYSIAGFGPSPGEPVRPRVFCASLADVFEDWTGKIIDSQGRVLYWSEDDRTMLAATNEADLKDRHVATMDDIRNRLFRLIDDTPNLDWLLLTKRPQNIVRMMPCRHNTDDWPRKNIWLGTSVENQQTAGERIPHLLKTPAAVRYLSVEPLLGPVDLRETFKTGGYRNYLTGQFHGIPCKGVGGNPDFTVETDDTSLPKIDWVIVGGESGSNSRQCELAWIASIVKQCKAANVKVFVKQLGSHPTTAGDFAQKTGPVELLKLIDRKGGDLAEWPVHLRVREFPK